MFIENWTNKNHLFQKFIYVQTIFSESSTGFEVETFTKSWFDLQKITKSMTSAAHVFVSHKVVPCNRGSCSRFESVIVGSSNDLLLSVNNATKLKHNLTILHFKTS